VLLLVAPVRIGLVDRGFFYLQLAGGAVGLSTIVFLIGRGWVFGCGFFGSFVGLGAKVSNVLLASGMENRARFSISLQCRRSE
jgi:hypothetical protein